MSLNCTCREILLTFYSNDTDYGSESFFQTATFTVSKIPPPFENFILFFYGLAVYALMSCLLSIRYVVTRAKSKNIKEITKKPTTVPWLSELRGKTVEFVSDVRFECCDFEKKIDKKGREELQGAVVWVEKIINKTYEGISRRLQLVVPCTARTISVPMMNFKCGRTCTEFKPNGYVAPEDAENSYYTYQMCGQNRIQVVRYVENDVTYVAGYCVYITRPYEWDAPYNKMHIKNCYLGPEYVPKVNPVSERVRRAGRAGRVEVAVSPAPITCPEVYPSASTSLLEIPCENPRESERQATPESHKEHLRNLQLHFCEKKQGIVAIGCVNGVVKHFDWNTFSKSYKSSDCKTCKLVEWEESPPPYHMLNIWTEEDA